MVGNAPLTWVRHPGLVGPVAKFANKPGNRRFGSVFNLGCPRMAGVEGSLGGPIQWPFSNFATGPTIQPSGQAECHSTSTSQMRSKAARSKSAARNVPGATSIATLCRKPEKRLGFPDKVTSAYFTRTASRSARSLRPPRNGAVAVPSSQAARLAPASPLHRDPTKSSLP